MMYTITKGPSKLATQRRTGPTQQVESKLVDLKCRRPQQQQQQQQQPELGSWPLARKLPLVYFHFEWVLQPEKCLKTPKVTKEESHDKPPPPRDTATRRNYESVAQRLNFDRDHKGCCNIPWQQVEQQLDSREQGDGRSGPVQYTEKTPTPELKALLANIIASLKDNSEDIQYAGIELNDEIDTEVTLWEEVYLGITLG
ncbi:PREDICTED: protein FAM195A-like [Thamnophis sirtalis]|uniref:Protein FAM195A-like n=1 Tax=Thamnophis sirtalis TaxID=35019 RepID=A0A6I9Y8K0_9SAUR|nr:PREDICTED: protein FAM195A-like [Thamnophis sirtalis]